MYFNKYLMNNLWEGKHKGWQERKGEITNQYLQLWDDEITNQYLQL